MSLIVEIIRRWELLLTLAWKEFRVRYFSAYLGFAWVIIKSLVLMLVLSLVFLQRTRAEKFENFPIFLLIGLIPWNFFTTTFSECTNAIVNNANLIKKVYFPRILMPLSALLANLFRFAFSLLILFIFILIFRVKLTSYALLLPLVVLFQVVFLTGISLMTCALCVSFRDVGYIVESVLLPWFFMTPIFFDYRKYIPERYWAIFFLNPMAGIIEMYRDILYYGRFFQPLHFWWGFIVSIFFLIVGARIFIKREKLFADFV